MARKYDGSASLVLTESKQNKILARARRMGSKVYAKVCFNLDLSEYVAKVKAIHKGGVLSPPMISLCFPMGAAA